MQFIYNKCKVNISYTSSFLALFYISSKMSKIKRIVKLIWDTFIFLIKINNKIKSNLINFIFTEVVTLQRSTVVYECVCHEFESRWGFLKKLKRYFLGKCCKTWRIKRILIIMYSDPHQSTLISPGVPLHLNMVT